MIAAFQTLALDTLGNVYGGADEGAPTPAGENREMNVGLTVPTKGGNLNLGVQGKFDRSEYAKCLDSVSKIPGITPADLRATCGLPGGGQ